MLKEVNHKRSLKESTLPASPGQENETDKSNSRRRGHKAAWFSPQIKQWYQKALPMEVEFLLIKDMVRKCPVCMVWNGSKHDSLFLWLGFNQRGTTAAPSHWDRIQSVFSEPFVLREASSLEANRKFAVNHPQMWTTPPLAGYMNCIWKDVKQEQSRI